MRPVNTNEELVDYLVSRNYIETSKVEEAFRQVDRKDFVPDKYLKSAYVDRALPIGDEATISAPHMIATNTELLEIKDNMSIVELGSGSGYQLAILSQLTRQVIGIEIEEDLAAKSRRILSQRENVSIIHGAGLYNLEGKFDRILYSFGTDNIEAAKEKITENGIIIAPINQNGSQKLVKWHKNSLEELLDVRFVREKMNDD